MPGSRASSEPDAHQGDLLLRPWVESDAAGMREAIDEDVDHLKPWLSWTLEEPTTLEATRLRLRDYVEQFRSGRAFRYAISPVRTPVLILGGAHLKARSEPDMFEVGYWVRRSAVRQGIAAAAVSRLVLHAFTRLRAAGLLIQCDTANGASAAFARAIGFEFLGSSSTTYPNGESRPVLEFAMTRENYRSRHAEALEERARSVRLVADRPLSSR